MAGKHVYGELPVEPGFKAPDFRLRDEAGKAISLYEFLDDHTVVLVFIRAVDDAHTGSMLEYLKDSYQRILYHCGDVLVVSHGNIAFNKGLVEAHRLPFHILSDEDCAVLKRYQIFNEFDTLTGPNIFIINCAGLIAFMYNGKNPADIVAMADVVAVLHDLAEAPGEIFGGVADRNL